MDRPQRTGVGPHHGKGDRGRVATGTSLADHGGQLSSRPKLSRLCLLLLAVVVVVGTALWFRPLAFFFTFSDLRLLAEGARNHSITVSQVHMHYYVMGPENGTPVVLVHGLGGRAEDWRNLAPAMAKDGYRVYMPDLPGFGRSEQPARFSYSIPDQAEMVVGFVDAMGLRQVDLGGWSMGGWIVQRVAAEHPERVRKLMLFDSAGI